VGRAAALRKDNTFGYDRSTSAPRERQHHHRPVLRLFPVPSATATA
jgi:hypothetical protein